MALVCLCNGVRESHIREAIRNGADSVGKVRAATTAGDGCGTCVPTITAMLATRFHAVDDPSAPDVP